MRKPDLVGKRFGILLVVEAAISKHDKSRWKCYCECGKISIVYGQELVRGKTTSCGCKRFKHGQCLKGGKKTPTYYSWKAMKDRCSPKHIHSKHYHFSGVRVCKRWSSLKNFIEDMGERPEGKTIDRFPNSRKIYNKKNCRWATMKEQRANRSDC